MKPVSGSFTPPAYVASRLGRVRSSTTPCRLRSISAALRLITAAITGPPGRVSRAASRSAVTRSARSVRW